jgi:hypothetical protein
MWDGAVSLAQNPVALLSIMLSMAVMFTLAAVYEQ